MHVHVAIVLAQPVAHGRGRQECGVRRAGHQRYGQLPVDARQGDGGGVEQHVPGRRGPGA